eukprot:TRINITY_DN93383_c0_g1_i1.p1 TRINITY_DN93383_c0_g1~~TRINITY_DN93383_c0_g1_i1.p1  ORF type:complete len:991 (+),score=421.23 TRINITY_DN93383_c0_g1_i1:113-3085(+)
MAPTSLKLALVLAASQSPAAGSVSLYADLLHQGERAQAERHAILEKWCVKEVDGQETQRKQLQKMKDQLAIADGVGEDDDKASASLISLKEQSGNTAAEIIAQQEKAADSAEAKTRTEAKLKGLALQVKSLQQTEKQLVDKQATHWFFGGSETPGLHAVRETLKAIEGQHQSLLEEIRENSAGSDFKGDAKAAMAAERAEQHKLAESLASRHAAKLAAQSGSQVIQKALLETETALNDAASICGLGRSVIQRLDEESSPLREESLELIGRVEGAEDVLKQWQAAKAKEQKEAAEKEKKEKEMAKEKEKEKEQAIQKEKDEKEAKAKEMKESKEKAESLSNASPDQLNSFIGKMGAMLQAAMSARAGAAPPAPEVVPDTVFAPRKNVVMQVQLPPQQPAVAAPVQAMPAPVQVMPPPAPVVAAVAAPPPPPAPVAPVAPAAPVAAAPVTPAPVAAVQVAAAAPPAKKKAAPPAPAKKADDDDDDLMLDDAPPAKPAPAKKPAFVAAKSKPVKKAAKAMDDDLDFDKDDDMPVAAPVKPHKQVALAKKKPKDDLDFDDDDSPPPKETKGVPASLRGGWQAVLAKKRTETATKKKAAPKKPDQSSAIMELMSTPKAYTAWTPDAPDTSKASKAAKIDLEKEFDMDDDDDDKPKKKGRALLQLDNGLDGFVNTDASLTGSDGMDPFASISGPGPAAPADSGLQDPFAGMPSFLQTGSSSMVVPTSVVEAVSLVLDNFAQNLNSMALMELSKSDLSDGKLEERWEKVKMTRDHSQEDRDVEAEKMCKSLQQKQDVAAKEAARSEAASFVSSLEAQAEAKVIRHEVAAREQNLKAFGKGSQSLLGLKAELKQQAAKEFALLQKVRVEAAKMLGGAGDEAASAPMAELKTKVERIESLSTEGEDKLEDAVAAAAARREMSEQAGRKELEDLKDRAHTLELKASAASKTSAEGAEAEKNKLDQMCSVTMEGIEARLTKEENERRAIRVAMIVLTSGSA